MGATVIQRLVAGATLGPIPIAGVPSGGTNEIQTITFGGTPTGGMFTLSFLGQKTAAIAWSATNNTLRDNIDAALEALFNIGVGGVTTAVGTMTAGIGTMTVTFDGSINRKKNLVSAMAADASLLTGSAPTVTIARTTPGVDASFRSAATGLPVVDNTSGVLYVNTSTSVNSPTWTAQT